MGFIEDLENVIKEVFVTRFPRKDVKPVSKVFFRGQHVVQAVAITELGSLFKLGRGILDGWIR